MEKKAEVGMCEKKTIKEVYIESGILNTRYKLGEFIKIITDSCDGDMSAYIEFECEDQGWDYHLCVLNAYSYREETDEELQERIDEEEEARKYREKKKQEQAERVEEEQRKLYEELKKKYESEGE